MGFCPPRTPLFTERFRLTMTDDPIGSGKLFTLYIYTLYQSSEFYPLTYLRSEAEDPLTLLLNSRGGRCLRALLTPTTGRKILSCVLP